MVPTLTVLVVEPHITNLLTPQFVRLLVYTLSAQDSQLWDISASGGNANTGAESLEDGPPSDALQAHLSVPTNSIRPHPGLLTGAGRKCVFERWDW